MNSENIRKDRRPQSLAVKVWQLRTVIVECLCALFLSTLVVTLFVQVIVRYVFAYPLTWSQEIVALSFTWLCFLGAAVAVKYRGHIVVDFLINLSPIPVQKAVIAMTGLVVVGFAVLLSFSGYKMMLISHGQATPALGLPLSYVYASLPVGGALIAYYEFRHIWAVWKGQKPPVAFSLVREEVPDK